MLDDGVRAKAQQLREQIERHNYQYYVLDNPLIPDSEYDRLFRSLQAARGRVPRTGKP